MSIKFSVKAEETQIQPAYDRNYFLLYVAGVDAQALVDSIGESAVLLSAIGINAVCEWLDPDDAEDVLEAIGEEAVIEYLKNNGYEVTEKDA
ncbi:TPA: hypothetical protein PPE37_000395 [Escherichia coli]|nr:hypothetical protein [Escherichia coli]